MKAAKTFMRIMRILTMIIMLLFLAHDDIPQANMYLTWFLIFTIKIDRLEDQE